MIEWHNCVYFIMKYQMNNQKYYVLILFLLWLPFHVIAGNKTPQISITPEPALLDQPLKIIISNLAPNKKISVQTSLTDQNKKTWQAAALFESNNQGMINLSTQAPISGSYKGINPMGLFWSMLPNQKNTPHYFIDKNGQTIVITVSSKNNPKIIAQKTIHRILLADTIERKSIRENGIVGTLFYPKNSKSLPGIVNIPGSGGGIDEESSALLAAHGYAVFALGYFGADGLPQTLENINLEYFQNALRWFKKQPQVNSNKIAILGESRGGELVLLIASLFPKEVNAVVAYVPSNVIFGGIPYSNRPAWKYHGKPITPFIGGLTNKDPDLLLNDDLMNATKNGKIPFHKNTYDDPYDLSALFIAINKQDPNHFKHSEIDVEKIQCPVLILAGEDDKLWPSAYYSSLVMDRLNEKRSKITRFYLSFPHTGHEFLFPDLPAANLPYYHPKAKMWLSYGGTMEANAHASEKAWQTTIKFLDTQLHGRHR